VPTDEPHRLLGHSARRERSNEEAARSAAFPERRGSIGKFLCNICGALNVSSADASEREAVSCSRCRSSIRYRAVVLALSRALFGSDLTLPEFPTLKSLRGFGLSDSDVYSEPLERRFSYTNTFYHRDPGFDLLRPDKREFGRYDFVICSDVLEHVSEPISVAFATLAKLLKPSGVLVLTVPYSLAPETIEHFPFLAESVLAEVNDRTVLVGRTESGEYRVFEDLHFHGGTGATLERRIFSDHDIRAALTTAGFIHVRMDTVGSRAYGVCFVNPCSLPIVASQSQFTLSRSGIAELIEQWSSSRHTLRALESSRWLRVGRFLGLGPKLR
jgi:SAM-dependent methyltransferase